MLVFVAQLRPAKSLPLLTQLGDPSRHSLNDCPKAWAGTTCSHSKRLDLLLSFIGTYFFEGVMDRP